MAMHFHTHTLAEKMAAGEQTLVNSF
jgi:hypothetical protein